MKNSAKKTPKSVFLCAAISGILMCLSFTFDWLWPLCFFALVPMLTALFYQNDRKFGIQKSIFLYIFCYYVPMMLWLHSLYPLTRYGIGNVLSAVLLTLGILAIAAIEGLIFVIAFLPYQALRRSAIPLPITFALLYVFAEFLQAVAGEFSFPWGRLGTLVCSFTPFIQSASLFGTLFLSLLIVLINGLLAYAIVFLIRKTRYIKPIGCLLAAVLIFSANIGYGYYRIHTATQPQQTIRVAIVQGNLGSIKKWDATLSETLSTYNTLTRQALENFDADLVLWPETAVPIYSDNPAVALVKETAQQTQTIIATGIFTRDTDNPDVEYNSLVAFYPDGRQSEPYSKQKLVPMGEYIPFSDWIDALRLKEPYLQPGSATTLSLDQWQAGGLICYESIYPQVARQAVLDGAEFFLMPSNDSWFGSTPALRQHLAHAQLRCVENGRYMARAGNTGISATITPLGTIQKTIDADTAATLTDTIGVCQELTLYTQIGDVIVLPCAALFAAGWIMLLIRALQKRKKCRINQSSETEQR